MRDGPRDRGIFSCVEGPTGTPGDRTRFGLTVAPRQFDRKDTARMGTRGRGGSGRRWPQPRGSTPCRSAAGRPLSGWNRRSRRPGRRIRACETADRTPVDATALGLPVAPRQFDREGQGADGPCRMSEPGRQGAPVVWQDTPQDGRMGGERATIARAVGEHDPDADRRGVPTPLGGDPSGEPNVAVDLGASSALTSTSADLISITRSDRVAGTRSASRSRRARRRSRRSLPATPATPATPAEGERRTRGALRGQRS